MSIFANAGIVSKVYRKVLHKFLVNDLWLDIRLAAKRDSVRYALRHMQEATVVSDRYDLLRYALNQSPPNGLVLEFGVEKGLSINCLARHTSRTVHGFDSFEGLPADWRGTMETKGKFSTKGRLPAVPQNVKLHVGWFDRTLPAYLQTTAEKAAFIHIDCDIYESTRTVFELLAPRIGKGTVIVFDEYFNYPGWRLHEYKAFQVFIQNSGLTYKYIGLSSEKGHVAVGIQ